MVVTRPNRPRRSTPRAITVSNSRVSRRALRIESAGYIAELAIERPRTRAECVDAERPCPWAGCRHHLAIEVTEVGSIKSNFPHVDVAEIATSCSLDVAAAGGHTLEAVGLITNLTRERVRQVEEFGLANLRRTLAHRGITDDALAFVGIDHTNP